MDTSLTKLFGLQDDGTLLLEVLEGELVFEPLCRESLELRLDLQLFP